MTGVQTCALPIFLKYPDSNIYFMGVCIGSDGKESACKCETLGFNPWVGKIPWRRKWQPTPVFLPGKIPQTDEIGGL